VLRGGIGSTDVKRACMDIIGVELRITNLEVNILARGPLGWALLTRETKPGLDKLAFGPLEVAQFEAGGKMELSGMPADGPYTDIDAFCAKQTDDADPNDTRHCDSVAVKGGKAPWQELVSIKVEDSSMGAQYLGTRIDDQWWFVPLGEWSTQGAHHGSASLRKLTVEDVVAGGAPELVLRVHQTDKGFTHSYVEFGEDTDVLIICSLGKRRRVSCANIVVGGRRTPRPDDEAKPYQFSVDASFDKHGRVLLRPRGKWPTQVERFRYETPRVLIFR
jgi:hypothetical protein